MHKHLCHRFAAYVDVLDLLRCDILPLGQLEDVLLSINNPQDSTLTEEKHLSILTISTIRQCDRQKY